VQVHHDLSRFRARGAELHLVGNGSRHFAQAFREELDITCPLYVDTKLEAYRALEMKRGLASTLGSLATWKNTARAMKAGFRQSMTRGDAWQLGGVLVVLPGGIVTFRHLSEAAGDHPPVEKLLEALPPLVAVR
jgi:AhpC/TSA antioxidant enzyme